jgi:regulation of enolase protein 1 (concanavalin A-like superfamily)
MAIASGLVFSRNRCAETRLAYNLAVFLANVGLPEPMADWSLTSLQLKLIKIGARVVRHARAITFQLAEVAVSGPMVRAILAAIKRLRSPPAATC